MYLVSLILNVREESVLYKRTSTSGFVSYSKGNLYKKETWSFHVKLILLYSFKCSNRRYSERNHVVSSSLYWMPWCRWKHNTTGEYPLMHDISLFFFLFKLKLICSFFLILPILTYKGQLYLQRIYRGKWSKPKHPHAVNWKYGIESTEIFKG